MRTALVSLLTVVSAVPGCEEHCHVGESQCDGMQIWTCGESDGGGGMTFSVAGDCCAYSMCVDLMVGSDRVAACSDTGVADPRCAGRQGQICDGSNIVECDDGYAQDEGWCWLTCDDPGDGNAFCTIEANDPRCTTEAGPHAVCDGETWLSCDYGAVTGIAACTAACVAPSQGDAFCATSAMPDPRCPAAVAWCDAGQAFNCDPAGYAEVQTCDASAPCTVGTLPDGTIVQAFCNVTNPAPAGCVVAPQF